MKKDVTTIRLQPALRKAVSRELKKTGLSFSDTVQLLLRAYLDGDVRIGVTQYPQWYMDKIHKELDDLREADKKGEVKRYSSAKELFDEILERK